MNNDKQGKSAVSTEEQTRDASQRAEAERELEETQNIPELDEEEHEEAHKRSNISALVVHEAVRLEGEQELKRASIALGISAIAAGLSMGFSLIARALLHTFLPAAEWTPLLENLGYSVGFLIAILGRQQLFTENTVTVIIPLLAHPTKETWWQVARLWLVVLVGNLLGAFIFALLISYSGVFKGELLQTITSFSQQSNSGNFSSLLLKGIFAGWLIGLMVWLLPAAEANKLQIIIILTYLVGLGSFTHIAVDSVKAFHLVTIGQMSWFFSIFNFLLPILIGNIIGGISLVTLLNYGQVAGEKVKEMLE